MPEWVAQFHNGQEAKITKFPWEKTNGRSD
jgi:hypothetical protein